jgi:hypothetical protein
MARIFLSPLIVDIRASQSDTVFSKWKGINYIRSRVIPANPQSVNQTEVREALAQLVECWQDSDSSMKLNNNYYASGKEYSGFNRFIGDNCVANRAGTQLNINMDNGYSLLTAWSAATGAFAGQVDIAWTPTPVPAGKKLMVAWRKLHSPWTQAFQTYAAGVASPQIIGGLTPATNYEFYGFLALAVPVTGADVGNDSFDDAVSHA